MAADQNGTRDHRQILTIAEIGASCTTRSVRAIDRRKPVWTSQTHTPFCQLCPKARQTQFRPASGQFLFLDPLSGTNIRSDGARTANPQHCGWPHRRRSPQCMADTASAAAFDQPLADTETEFLA